MFKIFKGSPAMNVAVFVAGHLVRTERGGRIVIVGPRTSVAMVPAGDVPMSFIFTERTRDNQEVVVQGDLVVRLEASVVVSRRNFGVNVKSGKWEDPDELEALHDDFRRILRGLVREEVRRRTLRENLTDVAGIEKSVRDTLAGAVPIAQVTAVGGTITALFVSGVTPANAKLKEALEAEEREKMLSAADKALHDRRQQNAERERTLKLYESETALKVEEQNAHMVEQQAKNKETQAKGDAAATRIQLGPFAEMTPGMVLSHAMMEMARSGHVATIHFTPEVVSAIQAAAQPPRP
jgi:hypothetical protein